MKLVTHWNSLAGSWKRDRYRLWRAHSDAVNRRLIERWLPGKVNLALKTDLFDEVAGDGLWTALEARARRVVGFDISTSILHRARQANADLTGLVADVTEIPVADAVFDTAVSISTLDHFEVEADLTASLRELYRVLRPGGRLILTLDNLANPKIFVRSLIPWSLLRRTGIVPYFVGVTYTPGRLRGLLDAVGFEVLETQALLHCPRILAVAAGSALAGAQQGVRGLYLSSLARFEVLSRLPTRFLTGHFTAVLAVKPPLRES